MTATREWKELSPQQIERALRGNRKDLDALVRWYGPVVREAVAARIRHIPALAVQMEDLVGSVWLELCRSDWKRLSYYDRARGELGYFIRLQAGQIAWSLVMRQLGRPELALELGPEPKDEGLESRVLDRDLLERLAHRAKARLGEDDWALFNATYIEGLTSEEVAQRRQLKPKTVYQQKHRLRAKLEAIVRELLAEERPTDCPNDPLVLLVVASLLAVCLERADSEITPDRTEGVELR